MLRWMLCFFRLLAVFSLSPAEEKKMPIEAKRHCIQCIVRPAYKKVYLSAKCMGFLFVLSICSWLEILSSGGKLFWCVYVWRPEVFEWIIGQMYGVNIGVVSAHLRCNATGVKSVKEWTALILNKWESVCLSLASGEGIKNCRIH